MIFRQTVQASLPLRLLCSPSALGPPGLYLADWGCVVIANLLLLCIIEHLGGEGENEAGRTLTVFSWGEVGQTQGGGIHWPAGAPPEIQAEKSFWGCGMGAQKATGWWVAARGLGSKCNALPARETLVQLPGLDRDDYGHHTGLMCTHGHGTGLGGSDRLKGWFGTSWQSSGWDSSIPLQGTWIKSSWGN